MGIDQLRDGESVDNEEIQLQFEGLGWAPLSGAIRYSSITQADGGGATYYLEPQSGIVYQRAGYW